MRKQYWSTILFLTETVTAYVETQKKSNNQRKKRSNSKKYGSLATDINHHQPEAQDDLEHCEEYMKKSTEERSKFLAQKKLCYGCYKPILMSHNAKTRSDRQICQICKKECILLLCKPWSHSKAKSWR